MSEIVTMGARFADRVRLIESEAAFVQVAHTLLNKYLDVFFQAAQQEQLRKLLDDAKWNRLGDVTPIYGAIFVKVGSLYDDFIKSLVERKLSKIPADVELYDDLTAVIKNKNIENSGRVLMTFGRGVSGYSIDYETVCKNIGTCVTGSRRFQLNPIGFTVFIGNCTPDKTEELLQFYSRAGNFWDEVGRNRELQTVLGSKRTRETGKLAKQRLKTYFDDRNQIVHGRAGEKPITFERLTEECQYFERLIKSIASYASTSF